jgi:hypothetical protein
MATFNNTAISTWDFQAFFILFDQEGQALPTPYQFLIGFEGDAVYQETLVSEQGEG